MINFLLYDVGGFSIEHARALAQKGKNHVFYFTPFANGLPKFDLFAPGIGFEDEGVEKIKYFYEYIDKADCMMFPFVGAGDLANYLRKTTKIPVYGAGRGEILENNRVLLKKLQKKLGLPVQGYVEIKGITALREFLKGHPNKVVKLDIFRGDIESLVAKDYDSVKQILDRTELRLGAFADSYTFLVEDFIKGIESGFDLYFNGKTYLKPYLWSWMLDGDITMAKWMDKLPSPIQKVADALIPALSKLDYRGMVSTEIRVTPDGTPYLIDLCARYPYPTSIAYTEAIKNYPEVIYAVASGKDVPIQNNGKYLLEVPLESHEVPENWIRLNFEEKYKKFIKLYEGTKLHGKFYSVKGNKYVIHLVACGDDMDKLIKIVRTAAEKVDAPGLDKDTLLHLDETKEKLASSKAANMPNFFA